MTPQAFYIYWLLTLIFPQFLTLSHWIVTTPFMDHPLLGFHGIHLGYILLQNLSVVFPKKHNWKNIRVSSCYSCTLLSCKSNLSKSQQYARSKWWLLWGRLHKVKYVRLTSKSSFSIRCVLCVHNCVHLYLASSHT